MREQTHNEDPIITHILKAHEAARDKKATRVMSVLEVAIIATEQIEPLEPPYPPIAT